MTLEEAERQAIEGSPEPAHTPGSGKKRTLEEPGTGRQSVFRGRYHKVTEEGDTVLVLVFNDITVFPQLKFKNKKQEEFYWRTVRDVKKTLPYAKLICETLLETYEYIETFPTQAEREKYLKEMESAIFKQYNPVLMRFTKNQADPEGNQPERLRHSESFSRLIPGHILARIRKNIRSQPQGKLQTRQGFQ